MGEARPEQDRQEQARRGQARPDQAVILCPESLNTNRRLQIPSLSHWECQRSQSSQAMSMEIN